MARLVSADRKATVTQITTLYNCACYVARKNQAQTRECRVEVVYSEGESKARESDKQFQTLGKNSRSEKGRIKSIN